MSTRHLGALATLITAVLLSWQIGAIIDDRFFALFGFSPGYFGLS